MSYESDPCPTCGRHALNERMVCDECGVLIPQGAARWSIGSLCPDDEGSDFCSAKCCLGHVERLTWDGIRGEIEIALHGKRSDVDEALASVIRSCRKDA